MCCCCGGFLNLRYSHSPAPCMYACVHGRGWACVRSCVRVCGGCACGCACAWTSAWVWLCVCACVCEFMCMHACVWVWRGWQLVLRFYQETWRFCHHLYCHLAHCCESHKKRTIKKKNDTNCLNKPRCLLHQKVTWKATRQNTLKLIPKWHKLECSK